MTRYVSSLYGTLNHTHSNNYIITKLFRCFSTDILLDSSGICKRYRAMCSPGLETYLSRETRRISNSEPVRIDKGYVDFIASNEIIWKFLFQTRFCQSLWVYLMDPIHVTHEKEFIRKISSCDWNHLIKFDINSKLPNIKVRCHNSRLSHTNMIKRCITEIIHSHKMNTLNMDGDKPSGDDDLEPAPALDLDVSIINNTCMIIANVSGSLDSRVYLRGCEKFPILPSIASAVSAHVLETNASDLSQVTIWDPFCNNGVMLLELYSLLIGLPNEYSRMEYPLKLLPYNDDYTMNKAQDSITIEPMGIGVRLLGSDSNPDNVEIAIRHLKEFEGCIPKSKFQVMDTSLGIEFVADEYRDIIKKMGRVIILTNFVYGNKKCEDEIVKSYKLLGEIINARDDWVDVYVVSGRASFRRHMKFEWHKELSFNNQGVKCELLRLSKHK